MKTDLILFIVTLIFMIAFLIMRVYKIGVRSLVLKTATSLMICASGLILSYQHGLTQYGVIMLMGMMCGVIGDNVLDLKLMYKEDAWKYLYYGFIAFGIGHIIYAIGITYLLSSFIPSKELVITILIMLPITALLALISLVSFKKIGCDFGKDKLVVSIYDFILTFMVVLTLYAAIKSSKYIVLFIGFLLFLISDAVLSLQYFGGKEDNKVLAVVNHLFYYMAQIIIIFSICLVTK